eukprot:TRINITY_DN5079_c0_g1_i2.p1 TRINITY_DN5079_c0_g1~~TRINITY_DN5079_c0_g1_i2.p1  ORF type:complete len:306 (+),score=23.23 TRINITY_DN5079_c0_g1_i2:73-990(+)
MMNMQLFLLCMCEIVIGIQLQVSEEMLAQIDCTSEEELDPSVEFDGPSCLERKALGECAHDYMIYGGFCVKTCGYCEKGGSEGDEELNQNVQQQAQPNVARSTGSLVYDLLAQLQDSDSSLYDEAATIDEIIPSTNVTKSASIQPVQAVDVRKVIEPYNRTLRGCPCPTWRYNGITYKGCANPNKSCLGGWCPVDPYSCMSQPVMRQNEAIEIVMDYGQYGEMIVPMGGDREYLIDGCHCSPKEFCSKTVGGCTCASGCTFSDFDVGGPWCEIVPGSCEEGYWPSRAFDGSGSSDYCKPGCCPEI